MKQGTIDQTRRDNFIRNGTTGGLPIGSEAAAEAIARVGRAINGSHWKPASEGVKWFGKAYGYRKGTRCGEKE